MTATRPGPTVTCPLCGGRGRYRLRAQDINRRLSEEWFEYHHCQSCAALFLANVPADLARFYPADYYDLSSSRPTPSDVAKLALVLRHARGGHLVEIGTGSGSFAAAAKRAGFRVTGIEMDARACHHLREAIGVSAVHSDDPPRALEAVAPAGVIALWHVIEHLEDPWALLESAAAALDPGGILVVATPNPDAFQLSVLGARWTHIDAPRHRFLLPIRALRERAGQTGLELVDLVTSDRTGRDWNAFGWQRALPHRGSHGPGSLALKAGSAIAVVLAPVERTGLRASTYTAMFQKNQRA